MPRRAVTIAPPCSAALPTSATITAATKNCDRPSGRRRRRASGRGPRRRTPSRRSPARARRARRRLHGSSGRRGAAAPGSPQVDDRDRHVEREQHGGHRERQEVERVAVGIAAPAGDGRHEEEGVATSRMPELEVERPAVDLPPPPTPSLRRARAARDETTSCRIVPRTTSGRLSVIAKIAMSSSGALPKLAFRKPPIPGPCARRRSRSPRRSGRRAGRAPPPRERRAAFRRGAT